MIELLVVVAIIAVLIAILLPALARARDSAKQAVCQSNLKEISIGLAMYSQEFSEWLPVAYVSHSFWWQETLFGGKYLANRDVYACPAFPPYRGATGDPTDSRYLCYGMAGQYNYNIWQRLSLAWHPERSEVLVDSCEMVPPSWVRDYEKIEGPVQWFTVRKGRPSDTAGVHLRHLGKASLLLMDMHVETVNEFKPITRNYAYPNLGFVPLGAYYVTYK